MQTRLKSRNEECPLPSQPKKFKFSVQIDRADIIKDLELLHKELPSSQCLSSHILNGCAAGSECTKAVRKAIRKNLRQRPSPQRSRDLESAKRKEPRNLRSSRPCLSKSHLTSAQEEQKAVKGLIKLCRQLLEMDGKDRTGEKESKLATEEKAVSSDSGQASSPSTISASQKLPLLGTVGLPMECQRQEEGGKHEGLLVGTRNPAENYAWDRSQPAKVPQTSPKEQPDNKPKTAFRRQCTHVAMAFYIAKDKKSEAERLDRSRQMTLQANQVLPDWRTVPRPETPSDMWFGMESYKQILDAMNARRLLRTVQEIGAQDFSGRSEILFNSA